MQKECVKCHKVLDVSLFPSFKRKSDKIYVLVRCGNCYKQYKRTYYLSNKEKCDNKNKKYVKENKEKLFDYRKEYRNKNKEKISHYHKQYYDDNKHELNEYKKIYVINRKKVDPEFKLRLNVSKLISSYLRRNGFRKNNESILNNIGYTIQDLKNHLESKFELWMTWSNHGVYDKNIWNDNDQTTWTWQIDHIIPQTKLPYKNMKDENFKKCWGLSNLQPISAKANLLKGNK